MIDGRYTLLNTPEEVFRELSRGEEIVGVAMRENLPTFDVGVYELQELEVWRILEMLDSPDVAVFKVGPRWMENDYEKKRQVLCGILP